ncbi:hypothetical protein [Hydrogenophaga sp.]|uniref:hypothetical protein n=1 Tax=Hydrogenophaga sp. TaxID=1904254 RepID=UPI003F70C708
MAIILIGTEVPEGMGHVAPWLDFCRLAIGEKHTVHMAGPDLLVLQRCIASRAPVKIWAAPRVSPMRTLAPTRSWPELLVSLGYAQPEWLAGAVLSWASILNAAQPDVVLTDYAPALMAACQAMGVRYAEVGGGFCVPPLDRDGSMPPFPGLDAADARTTSQALAQLTNALRRAAAAISSSGENARASGDWIALHLQAHRRIVLSPRELDHYDEREQILGPVNHMGLLGLPEASPHSAASSDQQADKTSVHIVAYLKSDTPRLDDIIDAMASTGMPAQIHSPGWHKPSPHPSIRFSERPLDLMGILGSNSVFVGNGGLASTGLALHRGSTVLMLPQHVEQIAMARRLVKTGVGGLFWSSNLNTVALSLARGAFTTSRWTSSSETEKRILEMMGLGHSDHAQWNSQPGGSLAA